MILIWGSRLYGKVDEIPGLGFVATRFGHLWFIPLIPIESHFVIREMGDQFYGVPLPLHWKSVLVTWGRVAAGAAGVILAVLAIMSLDARNRSPAMATYYGLLCAVCAAAMILSFTWRGISTASYDNAMRRAGEMGVRPGGLASIAAAYDRKEEALRYAQQEQAAQLAMRASMAAPPPLPVIIPAEGLSPALVAQAQPPPLPNKVLTPAEGTFDLTRK